MMNAINDQKKVLVKLRSEVNKAENRLERAMKVTNEIEMKRSEAENEIKTAERDTRMLSRRKEDLESEIRNLDQEKDEMKTTLEALQVIVIKKKLKVSLIVIFCRRNFQMLRSKWQQSLS